MVWVECHSLHLLLHLLQVSPLFSLLLPLLPPSKIFSPDGLGSKQLPSSPSPMDSSTSTRFLSSTVKKSSGTVMSKPRRKVSISHLIDRNQRKSLSDAQKCILPSKIYS